MYFSYNPNEPKKNMKIGLLLIELEVMPENQKILNFKKQKRGPSKLYASESIRSWIVSLRVEIFLKQENQGSGAEYSIGPHSGRPVFLWSTMKIWIVCFHF